MNRQVRSRVCLFLALSCALMVVLFTGHAFSQEDVAAVPVESTADPLIEAETVAAMAQSPIQWIEPTRFNAGYDRGFFIDSVENDAFQLKVNLQNQFRYFGFGRTQREWVDATGSTNRTSNRNDFEINRGRLIFSGHAIDPDLNYYVNLDYASLGDDRVTVLLAWMNYRFSREFDLYAGKGKVPGGREWLLTSMYTMSPDRSMATTFFRPSITTGVWARGEPLEQLYYQAMIGNGFNTTSAGFRDLDTNFVYSANTWWEPLGEFGGLYSDLSFHEDLAVRTGASLTTSRQSATQFDSQSPEETFIRLSDGTDLTAVGALAPGIAVTDYSLYLATFDAATKYRGVSLSGEYFLRWLTDISGDGPIPGDRRDLFDHGFHLQAGAFVVPKRVEVFARSSTVFGPFGNGAEYAGGFNVFFRGTENLRFCFDVTRLVDSPADQIRTGYSAGASGMLVRGQLQTMF
jgi:hypothetical protein